MENKIVIRKGYKFMLYTNLVGLFVILFIIVSLFITSDSKYKILSNPNLWISFGISFILFGLIYLFALFYIKSKLQESIKVILNSKSNNTFIILKSSYLKHRLFYDTETKLICLIDSYKHNFANLLVFTKNDIKNIESFCRLSEDSSKKKKNDLKYTSAGGLMGGVPGAMIGAVIDGTISDDPDKLPTYELGVSIVFGNGESKSITYDYESHKQTISEKKTIIRNFISKITYG